MNSILNNIVSQLYNARGNTLWCNDIEEVDNGELQDLLVTPSKNKNLIKGIEPTNIGYLGIKLTSLGINYFENGFKFDKELSNSISIGIIHNSGNFSIGNNNTQAININKEIDKILKYLDGSDISNKKEIKNLLKEIQKETDLENQKIKLKDILGILGNTASIGQLLLAIPSLFL